MPARKHKQPSEKQLKFTALLAANPEMKPLEAGRMAGYSANTLKNLRANVLDRPIVQTWLENYQYTLNKHNVNADRLATKLDQLLEAEKPIQVIVGRDDKGRPVYDTQMVDDPMVQLQTVRTLHDVFQVKAPLPKGDDKLKRRITLEEFDQKLDNHGQ